MPFLFLAWVHSVSILFHAYTTYSLSVTVSTSSAGVFSVMRPNPILHFAPFLSTHFFPCLNPIFKNWSFLSVVALVSVTLQFRIPPPPTKKDRFWHQLPPLSPRGLRQSRMSGTTRGKNIVCVSAEGKRRLHKNTACAHLWGFNRPFCLAERPVETPKVGVLVFGVFKVFRVFRVFGAYGLGVFWCFLGCF